MFNRCRDKARRLLVTWAGRPPPGGDRVRAAPSSPSPHAHTARPPLNPHPTPPHPSTHTHTHSIPSPPHVQTLPTWASWCRYANQAAVGALEPQLACSKNGAKLPSQLTALRIELSLRSESISLSHAAPGFCQELSAAPARCGRGPQHRPQGADRPGVLPHRPARCSTGATAWGSLTPETRAGRAPAKACLLVWIQSLSNRNL